MNQVIKDVCKIGQGAACCKYLTVDANGFHCMNWFLSSKLLIDSNWNETKSAQAEGCDGKDSKVLNLSEDELNALTLKDGIEPAKRDEL